MSTLYYIMLNSGARPAGRRPSGSLICVDSFWTGRRGSDSSYVHYYAYYYAYYCDNYCDNYDDHHDHHHYCHHCYVF